MALRRIMSLLFLALVALGLASAKEPVGTPPDYLGLGDSVPFGFISQAGFEYVNAQNFVGYPDWLAIELGLSEANAACPGETTGSFLSTQAPDAGCRLYRQHAPLHVNYGSSQTQFDYAVNYLLQNVASTAVITLQLGSNDVLLLIQTCNNDPQCISQGLPGVLATAGANMATILAGLRATGYNGAIVIVTYYSTDYTNRMITEITSSLNEAITAPAHLFGAGVADVFTAFQAASQQAGGRTCVAGLLNTKPGFNSLVCDIHPSQSGQKLIAQVIASLQQSAARK
jgi:lysophospholipase L1-like esterase